MKKDVVGNAYDGIEVFSATMAKQRNHLGQRVTEWISANATKVKIVDADLVQSSDAEYHCLSIVVKYKLAEGASPGELYRDHANCAL